MCTVSASGPAPKGFPPPWRHASSCGAKAPGHEMTRRGDAACGIPPSCFYGPAFQRAVRDGRMPFAARALEKAGHGVSVKDAGPPRFRHAATKKNLPLPPAPRAQATGIPPSPARPSRSPSSPPGSAFALSAAARTRSARPDAFPSSASCRPWPPRRPSPYRSAQRLPRTATGPAPPAKGCRWKGPSRQHHS